MSNLILAFLLFGILLAVAPQSLGLSPMELPVPLLDAAAPVTTPASARAGPVPVPATERHAHEADDDEEAEDPEEKPEQAPATRTMPVRPVSVGVGRDRQRVAGCGRLLGGLRQAGRHAGVVDRSADADRDRHGQQQREDSKKSAHLCALLV